MGSRQAGAEAHPVSLQHVLEGKELNRLLLADRDRPAPDAHGCARD